MPALFPPRTTPLARAMAFGLGLLVIALPVGLMWWVRQPPVTGQGRTAAQPVAAFSHRLHTRFRIDCRFCHAGAERAADAGLPATTMCVPCHEPVWLSGREFAAVRQSLRTARPIAWNRVNRVPDYVFFNHAIHVNKGVGCETCHGRVDRMDLAHQAAPLTMGWCLDCHQDPAKQLRPVSAVTEMGYRPARPQAELGPELARAYHVRPLTDCTTCHR
ncbi:MAG TPA: cytochrome c3 family protein [Gemmatimonadales bacterium]|nr:cytochrome c3 family protein [Gemmatimonadales bacterium]